jgi:hypothetical protein
VCTRRFAGGAGAHVSAGTSRTVVWAAGFCGRVSVQAVPVSSDRIQRPGYATAHDRVTPIRAVVWVLPFAFLVHDGEEVQDAESFDTQNRRHLPIMTGWRGSTAPPATLRFSGHALCRGNRHLLAC